MTNPYYTKTGAPASNTQGRSAPVRDEFALIEAAFDTIDVSVDGKAPIASPAFTGSPTAPTAAVVTDTTQLATTEFVHDAIGASGSLLPVQTGKNGKYLQTDGTIASWEALPVTWSIRALFQDNTGYEALPNQNIASKIEVDLTSSRNLYHNGNFICFLAAASAVCYTSPDGITWTARTLPSSAVWTDFAAVGTRILAGDGGTTTGAYSDDAGVTWTAATFPVSMSILGGGPVFFCSASSGSTYYTSTTGATASWTSRTLPNPTSFTPGGTGYNYTAFATGVYAWFGQGNNTGAARSGDSGATWVTDTQTSNYLFASTDGTTVRLIAGNASINGQYSSNYGDTWVAANFAANNFMRAVTYGSGGGFVAVGTNNSTGYLTTNKATGTGAWSSTAIGTTAGVFYDVAWNGTRYMAVGGTGAVKQAYTATDGSTWSACATVPSGANPLTVVAYDTTNSKWVATDGTTCYWSGDDGATWNTASVGVGSITWMGYLNGRALAMAATTLYETTDGGANWAAVSAAPTFYSIVWSASASAYFMKGTTGTIYRSPDLVSFGVVPGSLSATPIRGSASALMHLTNAFRVGFRSTDGIAWAAITLPETWNSTDAWEDYSNLKHYYPGATQWNVTANGGSSWTTEPFFLNSDASRYGLSFAGGYLAPKASATGLPPRFEWSHDGTDRVDYSTGVLASGLLSMTTTGYVANYNGTMVGNGITIVSSKTGVFSS